MAVVALLGGPGAPGVTSTALALLRTWPLQGRQRVLLAECDPDGGAVLPGALQSRLPAGRGLKNLAVSSRTQELVNAFWTQLVALREESDGDAGANSRLLLPGLANFTDAASLTPVWPALFDLFQNIEAYEHDVLVDLGRSGAFGPAGVLALRADVVLMVVRGTLRGVHAARVRVEALRRLLDGDGGHGAGSLGVLLITEGPYRAREVEEELGVPVVTTLPYLPNQAAVLSDGAEEPRRFMRGVLMRAARSATTPIRQRVATRRARLASPLYQRLQGVTRDAR
ncbi:hypothetical protein ACFQVC_32735 [Streptomyces monticola]|uniref:ParA family protein n=1 Tax=Streptomyces monticola TaxID=2666263 RepID=A0ABW2JTJ1_9ACTN